MLHFYTMLARVIDAAKSSERGAGLAEYALLLFLIAVACVTALTTLGGTVSGVFNNINGSL